MEIMLCKENLFYIRKKHFRFTRKKVAECLNISETTIRNAECGKHVSEKTIDALLRFYWRCEMAKQQLKAAKEEHREKKLAYYTEMWGSYV